MKTAILLGAIFFASITLFAQDVQEEVVLGFTNIKVFSQEIVPALSVEVKPKSLDKFDFMIAYASNIFTKDILQTPLQTQNPKIQNMYIAMNYRF